MRQPGLSQHDIRRLLQLLNEELGRTGIKGDLFLVGGAVMCLSYAARPSTQDVDGVFLPARRGAGGGRARGRAGLCGRKLAERWGERLPSDRADFAPFLELDHLRVLVAQPEYLLAMKCLAWRIGAEFHDEDDVRYLLRLLGLSTYPQALEVIARYYPLERFPQKTLCGLGELLTGAAS